MKSRTILVVAVCALLLVSAFECKKQKEEKNKKSGKQEKEKQVESKQQKEKTQKAEKAKPEKVAKHEKQEEPQEIKVKEVIIEAPKVVPEEQVHEHESESIVETLNHYQQKPIIKPKSLKVLNAYEQCKLECKKQRDSIHAQEYVEQLKAELAAAEAALAEEAAAAAASAPASEATQEFFN
ncbi:hypothetical protein OESDEN_08905 [Oesophagostomum dentatum]|uniref:Uncharacterized protein n=1 Tax=Oesophagostomum dentatum TaxID=61180 RepID=A0A0B1T129_OESDE|nr:hypothetical protein OESDEN_08905 [Oesophagostomum dentatum]